MRWLYLKTALYKRCFSGLKNMSLHCLRKVQSLNPRYGSSAIVLKPLLGDVLNSRQATGGIAQTINPGDSTFGRIRSKLIDVTRDGSIALGAGDEAVQPFLSASRILAGPILDHGLICALAKF